MPLGSSSAAPVISPGPSTRHRRMAWARRDFDVRDFARMLAQCQHFGARLARPAHDRRSGRLPRMSRNFLPHLAAPGPSVYARMRAIAGELVASTDPADVTVELIIGSKQFGRRAIVAVSRSGLPP